ncbi:phage major tropism determinant [Hydrogenophaga aquatica]
MTISSEVRKAGPFAGNNVTTSFPFSFKVFASADVVVVQTNPAGVETALTVGTDYTVTLNADQDTAPGGTVNKTTPLASGFLLTITSRVPNLQPLDLTNQGGFYPKVINAALDRLTILAQQNDEKIGRSVKVPISSSVSPDALIAQLTADAATAASAASSAAASQSAAAGSASSAASSASAASTSASAASSSQTAAATSQSAAATSATNAANSATAAAGSATTASTQASNAATSATDAANSATAAANSATAAAGSATTASTQASNAATSATNAANSATSASNSAALAQSFASSIVPASALSKADKTTPALVKTGANTLAIKAGTTVYLSGGVVSFASQTAVSMPALSAGEDYCVWVLPNGTAQATADPFTAPASAPVSGALKIGGFHYGLVASGTTVAGGSFATTGAGMIWTQSDVDAIAGINSWTLWDLTYRPICDPRGMACVKDNLGRAQFWFDLYFCSQTHITNGTSRFNTNVASGTVLPRIPVMFGGSGSNNYSTMTWYESAEIAFSHQKRLMNYQEFAAAAFGVTENQSLGGASSTIPATARQAGYTSKWGGEQMTGHHWTWGDTAHGVSGAAWVSGANRGQTYGTPFAALFGGDRNNAASSGSRCSGWSDSAWVSLWSIGLRAACDHLNL